MYIEGDYISDKSARKSDLHDDAAEMGEWDGRELGEGRGERWSGELRGEGVNGQRDASKQQDNSG